MIILAVICLQRVDATRSYACILNGCAMCFPRFCVLLAVSLCRHHRNWQNAIPDATSAPLQKNYFLAARLNDRPTPPFCAYRYLITLSVLCSVPSGDHSKNFLSLYRSWCKRGADSFAAASRASVGCAIEPLAQRHRIRLLDHDRPNLSKPAFNSRPPRRV